MKKNIVIRILMLLAAVLMTRAMLCSEEMEKSMTQAKFSVPFDFTERVPILKAKVNGHDFGRFILDTGAPSSRLHKNTVEKVGLTPSSSNIVSVNSFRFGDIDFGPLQIKISSFGKNRIDGLLGTQEIKSWCVTVDFDRSVCTFEKNSDRKGDSFSKMTIFRGRPLVLVEHAGKTLKFVLDTGSSANWLFVRGQDKLANTGKIVDETDEAKAAGGNLAVRQVKLFRHMSIGGRDHKEVRFLLSTQTQFGGYDAPEDGILGVGSVALTGMAVIDFPNGRFSLTQNK